MPVNPLSIPTAAKVNPLSIPGTSPGTPKPATTAQPVKAAPIVKPFSNTGLGITANTVLGIPKAAFGVAKDIAQGTARDTIDLGRTIQNIVTGTGSAPNTEVPTGYLKTLLGNQPIETIPTQYHNIKTTIENSPIAKKIGANKLASPLAFGAVLGNNILDFAPMGGEGNAIKTLAKESDVNIITKSLEKMGVHTDVAAKFASHIAETSDPKEIKALIHTVKGTQMIKHTAEAKAGLEHDLTYEPTAEESMAQMAKSHVTAPESGIDESALTEYNKMPPEAVDEAIANVPTHLEPLAEKARAAGSPEEFKASISDLQDRYLKGETLTSEDQSLLDSLKAAKKDRIGTAEEFYQRATDTSPIEKAFEASKPIRKIGDFDLGTFGINAFNRKVDKADRFPESELEDIVKNIKESFNASIHPNSYRNVNIAHVAEMPNGETRVIYTRTNARGNPEIINWHKVSDPKYIEQLKAFGTPSQTRTGISSLEENRSNPLSYGDTKSVSQDKSSGNVGIMDPTIEEQFARRSAGTPGSTIEALAKAPDAKSWQSLVKGYSRNLPKKEKAHLLDYMGTPEFVLEKLGLQKGAEMLQDAKDLYHKNLKFELNKIISWRDEVKGTPDSARRIFKYLDGEAKDVRHEMTDTEYRVAQDIKSYLKDWAKRLNLPEDKQISNYITHIFEKGDISLDDKVSPFDDPDLAVIMEAQPAKSVYDPFLEQRTGKKGYKQDVWAALDAYTKRATRKEAMDPALEKITEEARHLEGDAYEYVSALTHNVNMRPTKIDRLIDNLITKFAGSKFTDRPTAYLTSKFRNLFYRGSLGLNLSSALRNLSQGANTYAKLGEKYSVIGYYKVMKNLATHNLAELYEHGILDDAIVQDRKLGVYKSLLQKLDPILYKMFDTAEKINRGAAFWGAKARAIDKGLSEEEAIKYAKRMVRETQFSFSAVDSAVALGGDAVKTALQLQNYNIKQIEFFTRMLQNKEYAGLARWTIASLAFVYSIGRAFGMTPAQLLPGVGIGGGSGSPMANLIDGLVHLGDSNSQKRASAQQEVINTGIQAIPAGIQIKKTVQGLQAYNAGKDVTASGNTRYKVPHDTQHLIQAALFGKSALPEAQQYYKKLNNPKSKKSQNNPLRV